MTPAVPPPERKRRSYRKSRQGCRNCKLRRVKCDETKPQCQKCQGYGVWCNFDPRVADLQAACVSVTATSTTALDTRQRAKSSQPLEMQLCTAPAKLAPPLHPAAVTADAGSCFELDAHSLARLMRFRQRTVGTMANAQMVQSWDTRLLGAAFRQPHLMHTILALTATHDRYLDDPSPHSRRSGPEVFHWTQCVSLLNKKLSGGIEPDERDAVWASAALLSVITFASLDLVPPDQSWPNGPPQPTDLAWVRLGEAKTIIWHLTDPARPDSAFRPMSRDYAHVLAPTAASGDQGIPAPLARLCGLDCFSCEESSPFFAVAHALTRLQRARGEGMSPILAIRVMGHMPASFRRLLHAKHPVALLLLALFYEQARWNVWWMPKRAEMECRAICLYLRRWHGDHDALMALLPCLT